MQSQCKILIVEDDLLTQDVYRALFLKRKEFEIELCKNDEELYDALEKNVFDVFIIDLALGKGKDGVQLIKELRKIKKYVSTPIVVVTAFAMLKDERISLDAGATAFLRKPLEFSVLFDMLNKLLKQN